MLLTGRPFCLPPGGEAHAPLCALPRYLLCGVRVCLTDPGPWDRVTLRSCRGSWCSCRTPWGGGPVLFGGLPPGPYALTLRRGEEALRCLLELPPGGNVELCWAPASGRLTWRRDPFHYCFNST